MLGLCALALVLVTEAAMAYVWVNSYCKSSETCVQGHYRSNPDGNFYNNWSTYPNVNPFTGKRGTRRTQRY